MIRVLVKASSPVVKAGVEGLLREHPGFRVVADSPGGAGDTEAESSANVLLVEAATLADSTARQAMDWASAGGPVVLLLRQPAAERVAQALPAGVKAVLPS